MHHGLLATCPMNSPIRQGRRFDFLAGIGAPAEPMEDGVAVVRVVVMEVEATVVVEMEEGGAE